MNATGKDIRPGYSFEAGQLEQGPSRSRALAGRLFALLLGAWALYGCTEILETNFEELPDGQSPAGSLPGTPGGDSAAVTGRVEKSGDSVKLMVVPNQPLPSIELFTARQPHETTEYTYRLVGLRTSTEAQPVVVIEAYDGQDRRACTLQVRGGQFHWVSGAGEERLGAMRMPFFHDVFIRLDRAHALCFVLIRQQYQPNLQANARPFIDSGFGDLHRVRIAYEGAATREEEYFLDLVRIEKVN